MFTQGGLVVNENFLLTMPDRSSIIVPMNKVLFSKQVGVISALVEGNPIPATSRMTGVAMGTIMTLLESVGTAVR